MHWQQFRQNIYARNVGAAYPVAQADGNSRRRFNARETNNYLLDRNYLTRTGTVAAALRRRSLTAVR